MGTQIYSLPWCVSKFHLVAIDDVTEQLSIDAGHAALDVKLAYKSDKQKWNSLQKIFLYKLSSHFFPQTNIRKAESSPNQCYCLPAGPQSSICYVLIQSAFQGIFVLLWFCRMLCILLILSPIKIKYVRVICVAILNDAKWKVRDQTDLVWTMKVAMLSTLTRMVLTTPDGTRISELVVAFTRGQKLGPEKKVNICFNMKSVL